MSQAYNDDDLVYVDPETRTVIGKVEWTKGDKPKSMPVAPSEGVASAGKSDAKGERRRFSRQYYPWGTYRSMKRIYKLDGNVKEAEPNHSLEQVLPKALDPKTPFWD